jgi:hypothetical protein
MIMQRRNVVGILQTACLLSVLTSNLLAADPLDSWRWSNPLPNGVGFNGVIRAGGLIVGVGNAGTIMTSPDLTSARWVKQAIGANLSTLNAVAYGNNTFVVAAGDSLPAGDKTQRFLTSTDGTNWFTQTWPNANTRAVYGLAYGAGLFVAVCERAEIWTSPDGTNWTQRVSPQTGSSFKLAAVTYRPDVGFVAVGDAVSSLAEIETSPDGITWSLQPAGVPAFSLNGITWGYVTNADLSVSTNFVAVGGKTGTGAIGTITTSPDGTNWTTQISGPGGVNTTSRLFGTAFKPGVGYIAIGLGSTIQYSTDGTNWNASFSDLSVPGNDFAGATYASDLGYFVGVGSSGMVETSPADGGPGTWTGEFTGRPENLTGIARGGANFVVVGNVVPFGAHYAVILTSSSGSRWTVRTSGTTLKLNNVAYGAGVFVAVGNSGAIVTSADEGTNWAVQTSGVVANLNGVNYITNSVTNIFLATGATGALLTSPDGTNWTAQTAGTVASLFCSCPTYAAGVYVVGGAGGVMLTSPDATTWTARNSTISGTSRDINGLAYANNNFVAACGYGFILTSPDGIIWSQQVSPFGSTGSTKTYYTVAYAGGVFVMGGTSSSYSSATQTSTDGTNWVMRASPSTSGLKAIAYAPNTYLGVGNSGMILQAGALLGPLIQYSEAGGTLTMTWPGGGTLQASSPDVAGPYTNVPGAVSPWPITPMSDPSTFFRVQVP